MESMVVQTVKNLPAMQETRVLSLHWEDPLEKGTLQYSCRENSILLDNLRDLSQGKVLNIVHRAIQ